MINYLFKLLIRIIMVIFCAVILEELSECPVDLQITTQTLFDAVDYMNGIYYSYTITNDYNSIKFRYPTTNPCGSRN